MSVYRRWAIVAVSDSTLTSIQSYLGNWQAAIFRTKQDAETEMNARKFPCPVKIVEIEIATEILGGDETLQPLTVLDRYSREVV